MAKIKLKTKTIVTRLSPRYANPSVIAGRFFARTEKTKQQMMMVMRDAIEKELKKSKFMNALIDPQLGVRGQDLPAEFGLPVGAAKLAYDVIMIRLLSTCKVSAEIGPVRRVRNRPSSTITIKYEYLNPVLYQDKFDNDPFSYYSENRATRKKLIGRSGGYKYKIDWMKWVLDAKRGNKAMLGTLPSLKSYGIGYDLTTNQQKYSRSGRALMFKNTSKNRQKIAIKNFPYEFPEAAIPSAGYKNFIEAIANNPKFTSRLNRRLQSIMNYYLVPRKR